MRCTRVAPISRSVLAPIIWQAFLEATWPSGMSGPLREVDLTKESFTHLIHRDDVFKATGSNFNACRTTELERRVPWIHISVGIPSR